MPAIAIIAIVVAAICGLGAIAAVISVAASKPPSESNGRPLANSTTQAPAPKRTYYQPKLADFVLTVKILEKKCFGSAGCNIDFRVEAACDICAELDPAKTYEVTYEIRGGEDTLINTLEVTGDTYKYDERESIGTKSSKAELTAVVTSVTAA